MDDIEWGYSSQHHVMYLIFYIERIRTSPCNTHPKLDTKDSISIFSPCLYICLHHVVADIPIRGLLSVVYKNSTISKKALERGLFYFPIFTHMGRPSSHRSYDHDHTTFCRHQPATKRVSLHSGADTRRFARLHQHMYRSIFLNLYSVS